MALLKPPSAITKSEINKNRTTKSAPNKLAMHAKFSCKNCEMQLGEFNLSALEFTYDLLKKSLGGSKTAGKAHQKV